MDHESKENELSEKNFDQFPDALFHRPKSQQSVCVRNSNCLMEFLINNRKTLCPNFAAQNIPSRFLRKLLNLNQNQVLCGIPLTAARHLPDKIVL